MARIQRLSPRRVLVVILCLMLATLASAQETAPQPTMTMLGFEHDGTQIEWILTIGNTGAETARHVVVSDTLPEALRVDTVQITTGSANVSNQTVTVVLPELAPGEVVQFSILTTELTRENPANTACVTADNYAGNVCVQATAVQSLPATGETPYWRRPLLTLSLLTISASLLMIGMGLFGWHILDGEPD